MQVEKIHDVQRHVTNGEVKTPRRPPRLAVINMRVTRFIAFLVVTLSMLACATVCILAVWGMTEEVYAWRALGSLGIVSAVAAVFVSLNEGFGPAVRG